MRALTALKKKDGNLSQIEVNEMPSLMGNVTAKVSSNDAMPSWIVFFVKFLFDECSNILKINNIYNEGPVLYNVRKVQNKPSRSPLII